MLAPSGEESAGDGSPSARRANAPNPVARDFSAEDAMEFVYVTLSDNHYENNTRSANQFVADITAEALYADQIGLHSAWIGEHHFNSLGVLSCPDLVLSYI